MAITITQTPNTTFDMAYGANPITLDGITPNEDKYALRIYKVGVADPIADIRQTPNKFAKAIFDVQNILQSQVGPTLNNIDALGVTGNPLQIANGELIEYQIGYNTETDGVLDGEWTIDPTIYTTIAGSKQYFEVPFDASKYQAKIAADDGVTPCTILDPNPRNPQGLALSDNEWQIDESQTGDDFLSDGWSSPDGINVHNVYPMDQCTKSFYQVAKRSGSNPPNFNAQGIDAFIIAQYTADGVLANEQQINNIQANGGGPNVAQGQGLVASGNYEVITIGCGPDNLGFTLDPLTTHYYVMPLVYSPCGGPNLLYTSAWKAQRYNLNQDACNDYPHIQFAWLNSLGFRDQFTFTKKNEKSINTTRNEYLKEAADYNSTSYNVDIQSRGYTTYSQTIKETWTATTGYINDEEAKLLESMFKSAQVNARWSDGKYGQEWVPVRIQTAQYTQKTNRKDKLFQYTVTFTVASNIKSQRG